MGEGDNKKYYDDYVYVNQDTLKTKVKCKKVVSESVSNGKNIIIDNTTNFINKVDDADIDDGYDPGF